MSKLLAADTGGTFTDIAVYDVETGKLSSGKILTDYNDLVDGIFNGIAQTDIELKTCKVIKHGTTQVINDLLQQDGAKVALITTKGFRDVLEIRRGTRPVPFNLTKGCSCDGRCPGNWIGHCQTLFGGGSQRCAHRPE